MQLRRFSGSGVHGFLKFDLPFNSDLTFLTGINGSGKTSALNAILGLVTPDLGMLAALEFESISLELTENEGSRLTISAAPTDTGVELSVSTDAERLSYSRFVPDPDASYRTGSDSESEYYRELISVYSSHPVIRKISSLPTPMFLGLDRRPRFGDDVRRIRYSATRARARNPFAGPQNLSVIDAAALAEDRNRETVIRASRVVEELQQQMLLSLITVIPGEASDFIGLKVPTTSERHQLRNIRKNLSSIAAVLGLQPQAVSSRLRPLLDNLDSVAKLIPDDTTFSSVFGPDASPPESLVRPIFTWSANQPHLNRIVAASEIAEQYNKIRTETLRPMDEYRDLINDFLSDSGKEIVFNDRGEIGITIKGVDGVKSISQLSSGEAQIFVILTHLALNQINTSSVFIIDEPELSLHLRWQELFVDSLIAANSSVQYILATHSPSIILDRVDRCLDADRGRASVRRRRRGRA